MNWSTLAFSSRCPINIRIAAMPLATSIAVLLLSYFLLMVSFPEIRKSRPGLANEKDRLLLRFIFFLFNGVRIARRA